MKINEVEAQVGITKKNIRFYEDQGLLKPHRNSQNGYREYGPREVEQLKQIKLLRKLGVPIEEIRQMQSGAHTVGDGMRRHLISLERERRNLEHSMELCRTLKDREQQLDDLETDELLSQMDGFALEEDPVPMPLVVVLVAIPGVVIFGVLLAVAQRFREIEKGEADDAKQY